MLKKYFINIYFLKFRTAVPWRTCHWYNGYPISAFPSKDKLSEYWAGLSDKIKCLSILWNRLPVQVGCMRQVLRAGALGRPRGMGWGGRWEGGSGWGTHVNPWLIHVNVWQKILQYCKVISLQLIKINEKKKERKEKKRKKNKMHIHFMRSVGNESLKAEDHGLKISIVF